MSNRNMWWTNLVLVGSYALAICLVAALHAQPPATDGHEPAPIENVIAVTPRIVSGGEPVGAQAFRQLHDLGVRTVVSVDGTTPDVETARKFGLRYVHIPFGYHGIPRDAVGALTRVMRECEGPVFVHCHHGKHRGPAAAAVCARVTGELSQADSLAYLEHAGTSRDYAGLWRGVSAFRPLPADAVLPELVETAAIPPLAQMMVRVDGHLSQLQKSLAPEEETRTAAVQLAVLLREEFREGARLLPNDADPDLRRRFDQSSRLASQVEDTLRTSPTQAKVVLEQLSNSCVACHRRHRDQ